MLSFLVGTFVFPKMQKGHLGAAKFNLRYKDKKIMIVQSYHPGLIGVDGGTRGVKSVLDKTGVDYRIRYMDTRQNPSEEYKKSIAIEVRDEISRYKPDAVILFDDNAFKYLAMPYYKNASLPIVFGGIDWDISIYDAPYENSTGIISVALITELLEYMKTFTSGDRVAYLGYESLTAKKEIDAYRKILGIEMSAHYVKSFAEWKTTFLELQDSADIVIHSGLLVSADGWDLSKAEQFVMENVKVPIGTVNEAIMSCAVLGLVKNPEEAGEWTAESALKIIDGAKPADIPVTRTKKGRMVINLEMAKKLNISFDLQILRNAKRYRKIDGKLE